MINKLITFLLSLKKPVIPEEDQFHSDGTFKTIVELEKEGWYDHR